MADQSHSREERMTEQAAEIAWSANDCWSCHERGHECSPGAQPPVVTCPGEECARCDYAYEEDDGA